MDWESNIPDAVVSVAIDDASRLCPASPRSWRAGLPQALAGRRQIWLFPGLFLAIGVPWAARIGLTVDGIAPIVCIIAFFLVLSRFYKERSPSISNMTLTTAALGAFISSGVIISYVTASCGFPLQDEMLKKFDQLLGFDWITWRNVTISSSIMYYIMLGAYNSMQIQVIFLIFYFSAPSKNARVVEFLFLTGATLAVTAFCSIFWPALGPFAEYGDSYGAYPFTDLLIMRAGGPWHFKIVDMQGIISFPSYHTVMAVLLTYGFRGTGLVGHLIAALNALMLLSLPSIGGHYLVDMIAGGVLAFVAIAAYRAAGGGLGHQPTPQAGSTESARSAP